MYISVSGGGATPWPYPPNVNPPLLVKNTVFTVQCDTDTVIHHTHTCYAVTSVTHMKCSKMGKYSLEYLKTVGKQYNYC